MGNNLKPLKGVWHAKLVCLSDLMVKAKELHESFLPYKKLIKSSYIQNPRVYKKSENLSEYIETQHRAK